MHRFLPSFLITVMCAASALLTPAPARAAANASWVLTHEGKSTNAFIWDKRARALVRNTVPRAMASDVLEGLGGPPDPVQVRDRRYFSASACVVHSCPDKGLFWLDVQSGVGLGARLSGDTLTIAAKRMAPASLPPAARQAIIAWLNDYNVQPKTVRFVGADGLPTPLSPDLFIAGPRFKAPIGGPSFDCTRATTTVETAICTDPGLAKQDLELASVFNEVRHGHATIGARNELTALQRTWLVDRDAACMHATAMAACLGDRYRRQHERIINWVPMR